MKPERIEQIRTRVEAATAGPWRVVLDDSEGPKTVWRQCESDKHPDDPERLSVYDDCCFDGGLHSEPFYREADAEFVAHARVDVPWLLDRLDQIRRLCENYTPVPPPLFRGPGLSEHGEGYNRGTRDMAAAVLGVLAGEEEST